MCSGVSRYFVHWVHSYLVCSCYSRSGVCLETWLYYLLNMVHVAVLVLLLRLYSILYVVGNEQARCTVLATMYNIRVSSGGGGGGGRSFPPPNLGQLYRKVYKATPISWNSPPPPKIIPSG